MKSLSIFAAVLASTLLLSGCATRAVADELPADYPTSQQEHSPRQGQPGHEGHEGPGSEAQGHESHEHADHDAAPEGNEGHKHDAAGGGSEAGESYTCPMHPEVVSSSPGQCSKCGMHLEKKK